jgi:tRNA modification GTPase
MPSALSEIAILTPPGRGAVAVIACAGDIALLDGAHGLPPLCIARDGRLFNDRPINQITFARWGVAHPEDVVVCRTSERTFEVHCHGGRAAVERIREDLLAATGGESALAHQAADEREQLLAAAWDAVSRATTLRTADLLLHQAAEAWPAALSDAQGADAPRSPEWKLKALEWKEFGRHLTEPWSVALVGAPNAGKSSLMNELAGFQRSIVNPTPGTTRDAVTLDVAFDGWPIRLIDTAGLREGADELEAAGIERARRVIADADLVLQVFDVTKPEPAMLEGAQRVANKVDLRPDSKWPDGTIALSALTGAGVETLIERVTARLVPNLPPRGLAIPVSTEHVKWLEQ